MEEKKIPGIPEGKESEYYAGDLSERHAGKETISVKAPGRISVIASRVWEIGRKGILAILSLGGAYALTDPGIRERLLETLKKFADFAGGR